MTKHTMFEVDYLDDNKHETLYQLMIKGLSPESAEIVPQSWNYKYLSVITDYFSYASIGVRRNGLTLDEFCRYFNDYNKFFNLTNERG